MSGVRAKEPIPFTNVMFSDITAGKRKLNTSFFSAVFTLTLITLHTLVSSSATFALTADEINDAEFSKILPEGQSALTVKLQVLLDRAGAKPGVIDGMTGENVAKAIRSFEEIQGVEVDGIMDPEIWQRLQSEQPVAKTYKITAEDVAKIVEDIPEDYEEMAAMEWLGYTSGAEAMAEKFHMDQDFLEALNPGLSFAAGETIVVVDPGSPDKIEVSRIVAEKSTERLVVYGKEDKPVIIYPATIGSENNPSPNGTHEINGVKRFPTYAYNPEKNFQQGDNSEKLTIPPGPNGPVGSVWIDLSKPTYGIHGTPHPSKIAKAASHGCVRLTNWDAMELASLVEFGIEVTFKD